MQQIDQHLKPIEKQSLAQTVLERLLSFIQSGEIRPGQPLPSQHALAEQLSVSRPILREAMQGLASMGVVEIRPGSGCFVRDPHATTEPEVLFDIFSHNGAIEVLDARMVVEVELASMAAVRATEEDFEEMKKRFRVADVRNAGLFETYGATPFDNFAVLASAYGRGGLRRTLLSNLELGRSFAETR